MKFRIISCIIVLIVLVVLAVLFGSHSGDQSEQDNAAPTEQVN
jgi:hypothetical protein